MLELLLLAVIILLIALLAYIYIRKKELEERLESLLFDKRSQSVKYGKLTEQFIPFTDEFPFDPGQFRFLGNPIDGVVFGNDEITFCEFKTSGSKLSDRQKRVREIVEAKKVKWFEFSMK